MKKTLIALLALCGTATFADTLYVTPAGAGSQDGSSWANAFAGIQAAVDAADAAYAADGTLHDILVTNGVYSRVALSRDFALQVRSVNGAASTIIDGERPVTLVGVNFNPRERNIDLPVIENAVGDLTDD
ncbi:MAG: hypothetical protein IJR99_14950 [Kiritimatiellae bacterium]|nr:hypothetical protein [Kiritimatiellia bacterium]